MNTERSDVTEENPDDARTASSQQIAHFGYILWALSLVLGFTCIIALIMAYVKREDARGTWVESHFRWQIRTFWFSLLWAVIGAMTSLFIIGILILVAVGIWVIYRIVLGWIRLSEKRAMYE